MIVAPLVISGLFHAAAAGRALLHEALHPDGGAKGVEADTPLRGDSLLGVADGDAGHLQAGFPFFPKSVLTGGLTLHALAGNDPYKAKSPAEPATEVSTEGSPRSLRPPVQLWGPVNARTVEVTDSPLIGVQVAQPGQITMGYYIYIPVAWSEKLVPGSLRPGGTATSYTARLACAPETEVNLKVIEDWAVSCTVRTPRLRSIEGFVNIIDVAGAKKTAFMLTQKEDSNLASFINQKHEWLRDGSRRELPSRVSLPLIVDILRGTVLLNNAGILCVLTERILGMKDGRVVFSNFDMARTALSVSSAINVGGWASSASREAPEMDMVLPSTWAGANVWSVGLVIASMFTDRAPTERFIENRYPDIAVAMGTPSGDNKVRQLIRSEFLIGGDALVNKLQDVDIKALIFGLLEVDPKKRWTAEEALDFTLRLAEDRGIDVPSEPWSPVSLPDCSKNGA